ncbi:MAG: hypothetical protein PHR47_00080 [Candidatus Pacebacteria bacterium]|nr:hypothetical protein [Candidatus Paceibacterota bacterium]
MPNDSKIESIIKNSGHNLHFEVVKILKACGWEITISQFYLDPVTGKQREIDIVAIKSFKVAKNNELKVRLVIECKQINSENVIWFDKKNISKTIKLAKDNIILQNKEDMCLKNTSVIPNKIHHYIQDLDVAKLSAKNGKSETDPLFDLMNGCFNALVYFKENLPIGYYSIDYPLAILQSFENLYKKDNSEKGYSQINQPFELEVDYSYPIKSGNVVNKYFLLDIVSIYQLESFLDNLEENDISLLRGILNFDINVRKGG